MGSARTRTSAIVALMKAQCCNFLDLQLSLVSPFEIQRELISFKQIMFVTSWHSQSHPLALHCKPSGSCPPGWKHRESNWTAPDDAGSGIAEAEP